jgi:hypothetical protein
MADSAASLRGIGARRTETDEHTKRLSRHKPILGHFFMELAHIIRWRFRGANQAMAEMIHDGAWQAGLDVNNNAEVEWARLFFYSPA